MIVMPGDRLVQLWQLLPRPDDLIDPPLTNYVRIVQATARKMRADLERNVAGVPHTRPAHRLYVGRTAGIAVVYSTRTLTVKDTTAA